MSKEGDRMKGRKAMPEGCGRRAGREKEWGRGGGKEGEVKE